MNNIKDRRPDKIGGGYNKRFIFSVLLNIFLIVILMVFSIKLDVISKIKVKLMPEAYHVIEEEHYQNRWDIFKSLPDNSDEVIFLGDSITDMNEWCELFPEIHAINRGIASDTTEGVRNRLDEIVESRPKKIFIMLGINDIGNGLETDEIIINYAGILKNIKDSSPRTIIYIQSVLPCNSDKMKRNGRNARRTPENIEALNMRLEALAIEYDVHYIDLYSAFKAENGELDSRLTTDGVHLNGEGYLLWQELIENEVLY